MRKSKYGTITQSATMSPKAVLSDTRDFRDSILWDFDDSSAMALPRDCVVVSSGCSQSSARIDVNGLRRNGNKLRVWGLT